MKFGMVGGLGPASTLTYYREITEQCVKAKGTYPFLIFDSVPMDVLCGALDAGEEDRAEALLLASIRSLHAAGAHAAAIASNTPHILWDRLVKKSPLPLVSIVEETCHWVAQRHLERVLVLGTAFTMESGLYERGLRRVGVTSVVPDKADRERVHGIIFPNLENGLILPEDRDALVALCKTYIRDQRLDGVILGCTELPLLIRPSDLSVPVADTTKIHIDAITRLIRNVETPTPCPAPTAADGFSSPFASVDYLQAEHVVKLAWHQFAAQEDYRRPTRFALELMRRHPGAAFFVDARHGFEDTVPDIVWGFSYLLPEMQKAGCRAVVFYRNELRNDLDEELNFWTAEFARYFRVVCVNNSEDAKKALLL